MTRERTGLPVPLLALMVATALLAVWLGGYAVGWHDEYREGAGGRAAREPSGEAEMNPHEILWVTTEVLPGCDVRDAARLAVALAKRTGCGVKVAFQDAPLWATDDATVWSVLNRWVEDVGRGTGSPDLVAGLKEHLRNDL